MRCALTALETFTELHRGPRAQLGALPQRATPASTLPPCTATPDRRRGARTLITSYWTIASQTRLQFVSNVPASMRSGSGFRSPPVIGHKTCRLVPPKRPFHARLRLRKAALLQLNCSPLPPTRRPEPVGRRRDCDTNTQLPPDCEPAATPQPLPIGVSAVRVDVTHNSGPQHPSALTESTNAPHRRRKRSATEVLDASFGL